MAKYGVIDTSVMNAERPELTVRPHAHAAAVALAMPSVEPSGMPRKRAQFAAPLAALYNAYGLEWANGGNARVDRELGYTNGTNKNNHETGLAAYQPNGEMTPLIERSGKAKTGQLVFLTAAGVERCKQVDRELGRIARGFTRSAYDKLQREAKRDAKAAERAAEHVAIEADIDAATAEAEVEAPADAADAQAQMGDVTHTLDAAHAVDGDIQQG